jgi:Tol biopolymer transport system component
MPTFSPVTDEQSLTQLERIVSGTVFAGQGRSATLLRFLMTEMLAGRGERLKEYALGVEALGRDQHFDPLTDPIARVEASRLRKRLELYYALEGAADPVSIRLPKGGYQLTVETNGAGPRSFRIRPWPTAAVAMGLVAFALAIALVLRTPQPPQSPQRLEFELSADLALVSDVGPELAISQDGRWIAFVARAADGAPRLYLRNLARPDTREVAQSAGARAPFFSPDGEWVGFWAGKTLQKAPVSGGETVVLKARGDLIGAAWGGEGKILLTTADGRLLSMPASGGADQMILDWRGKERSPAWPDPLPDGRHALITAIGPMGVDAAEIQLISLDGKRAATLVRGGAFGRYIGAGHLAYVADGQLMIAPFDVAQMRLTGPAVSVADDVDYSSTWGFAHLAISRTGTAVYRRGSSRSTIETLDASGSRRLIAQAARYSWPKLSPDGRRLAVQLQGGGLDETRVYDLDTGGVIRLPTGAIRGGAMWSPDGRYLMFGSTGGLAAMAADGTGAAHTVLKLKDTLVPWSLSHDRSQVTFETLTTGGIDLWRAPVSADGLHVGPPAPLLVTPEFEVYPAISPDGRWFAYSAEEAGRWDVYVRRFPDGRGKVRVSRDGGRIPFWGSGGLFFRTHGQQIMKVSYRISDERFIVDGQSLWSPAVLADTGVLSNLDMLPDGRGFVVLRQEAAGGGQSQGHVTLLNNLGR